LAKALLWLGRLAPRTDVWLVALDPLGAVSPLPCACCGTPAARNRAEKLTSDQGLLVPYCDDCQRHVSAGKTRVLSVSLAGSLLAATLAAAVPLVWERVPFAAHVLFALIGALIPPAAATLLRQKRLPGHSAAGRAVWWLRPAELACTDQGWAAELARANSTSARRARLREPALSLWMAAGLVVALAATPLFHAFYHPIVRVLNLTDSRITVSADGDEVASVEPSSAESSAAGVEIRVAAGRRHLEARDVEGRVLASDHVLVSSAAHHLYAPASKSHCFWLERTAYGRAGSPEPSFLPLESAARFWVLPERIDTWFSANPPPSAADARSTGGVLTALRQAPCTQAPREAR
jgi:hypothetical protein